MREIHLTISRKLAVLRNLVALTAVGLLSSSVRAQTAPVAEDDSYSVSTGGTLITVAPAMLAVIEEILDATGDGRGATLSGPEGVAVAASGNVYVVGLSTDNAFKITPGGTVTEIINSSGDGVAALDAPFGIAVDSSENVFVAGSGTNNVFKITPGGVITEVIDATGDGAAPLLKPFGVAVDSADNLYASGVDSWNVFRVTPGGTITEIIDFTGDGTNGLQQAFGVVVDGSDNVYVTGRQSDNAFKITPGGVITRIISSSGDGGGNPLDCGNFIHCGIAVSSAGDVYITGAQSDNVFHISPGGAITEIIDASGDGLGNPLDLPQGVAVHDATGNVYVAGTLSSNVFEITPALAISEVLDSSGDGLGNPYNTPDGFNLAVDAAGNVFATAFTSNNAFRIPSGSPPPSSNLTQLIDASGDGLSPLVNPDGIDVDNAGNVYVGGCGNSPSNSSVFLIDTLGGITEILDGTGDGVHSFNCPVGIELDCQGNMFVAGHRSDNVFAVSPGGAITLVADASDGILAPFDIAIDGTDNVYVSGFGSNNVIKIAPNGFITEIIDATGDGAGNTLTAPFGLDVDAVGTVYVSGNDGDNAFRIDSDGTITELIDATGDGVNPFDKCADIAVSRAGNVYVTGNGSDNVFRITPGGTITQIASLADGLDNPTGVVVDANENVYVACFQSDNLFWITPSGSVLEILDSSGDGLHGFDGPADDCLALDGDGNVYVTGTLTHHNVFRIDAPRDGVLNNDSDLESDPLTASIVTMPVHGSLALAADGSFTYVHDGQSALWDSFTYKANDGLFDSNEATVTIGINPDTPCLPIGLDRCTGDGGDQLGCTDCPCGNNAVVGTLGGCLNSNSTSAQLIATGDTSVSLPPIASTDLRFDLIQAPGLSFAVLTSGDAVAPTNALNPCFGADSGVQFQNFDGLRCAVLNVRRHGGRSADANGAIGSSNEPWGGYASPLGGLAQAGAGFLAGQTRYFQAAYRDDPLLVCMRGLNTSQAVEVTFTP